MFIGGQGFRAFRPSRLSGIDEQQDQVELEKSRQENIQVYADRVRAGLPLFESPKGGKGSYSESR